MDEDRQREGSDESDGGTLFRWPNCPTRSGSCWETRPETGELSRRVKCARPLTTTGPTRRYVIVAVAD